MSPTIRAPRLDELELLRDIEWAAGMVFAEVGLPQVAEHPPESVAGLREYVAAGRVWVVVEGDVPVGYALVDIVDGRAHLEQISVRPEHGRRGLGSALLEHVCAWAAQQPFDAVTLTTFGHLEWNGPFYAKRGFRVMDDSEIGPELRGLLSREAAEGLDPALRVCMRRSVGLNAAE